MVKSIYLFAVVLVLLTVAPNCFCHNTYGSYLYPQFYDRSCPQVQEIVRSVVAKAVSREVRMAASFLRLHFHDCFVKGCDASILLDSTGRLISEKRSNPNRNSARGFEVIDEIKFAVEEVCPHTISCADIMALAARDSTVLTGEPTWVVPLGRRDSKDASLSGSNNNIPAPNNTFQTILTKFKLHGLDIILSTCKPHHRKCKMCQFQAEALQPVRKCKICADYTLDQFYASQLRARCPRSGGDQNLFFLDFASPVQFDNSYFENLLSYKGPLNSEQVLVTRNPVSLGLVKKYAESKELFFEQFAKSMVKMGNISPLTGPRGEIRKHCTAERSILRMTSLVQQSG